MPKSIIYRQNVVENKNPHHLANDQYYLVYVTSANGEFHPALFTHNDILQASVRASLNPEDAPKLKESWFKKFLRSMGICE